MANNVESSWVDGYVLTPYLEELVRRAMLYLESGLPLHLRGPAGAGKTSLAFYLAARRERPIYVLYGNEEFRGLGLLGDAVGSRKRLIVDNYVHTVMKRTEESELRWVDSELLRAVRDGGTLIYDEFTRSRPEANNVLLSILEEGVVPVPAARRGGNLISVHRDFRIILTSNPTEYAGVNPNTDALRDRLLTLDMAGRDLETDRAIIAGRSQLSLDDAEVILRAVRRRLKTKGTGKHASLRPALMIAQVLRQAGLRANPEDPLFVSICDDVVGAGEGRALDR